MSNKEAVKEAVAVHLSWAFIMLQQNMQIKKKVYILNIVVRQEKKTFA